MEGCIEECMAVATSKYEMNNNAIDDEACPLEYRIHHWSKERRLTNVLGFETKFIAKKQSDLILNSPVAGVRFREIHRRRRSEIEVIIRRSVKNMDPEAARTSRDSLDLAFHMSNILDTGLDRQTLSILIALCDMGLNPEALAAVVKELARESSSSSPPPAATRS
nr:mitotic-spindle organizing protein 1B [Ipomoea batatas]